jgi:hypothetical protein
VCLLQWISICCWKCVLQRICDSLLKLSCLQQISIRWRKCVCCKELAFAAESVLFTMNLWFAAELCGLLETSFHCRIVWPAVKQFLLPNYVACSEPVFVAKLCGLQRNSFRCWFSTIDPPGRNDLNACNNFIIWWCKMWNTWMWTYGLLK